MRRLAVGVVIMAKLFRSGRIGMRGRQGNAHELVGLSIREVLLREVHGGQAGSQGWGPLFFSLARMSARDGCSSRWEEMDGRSLQNELMVDGEVEGGNGELLEQQESDGIVTKVYESCRRREDADGTLISQYIKTTPGRIIYNKTVIDALAG